jgi:hypothetical protein
VIRAPITALGLVLAALPGCAQEAAGPPEDRLKRRVVYSGHGFDIFDDDARSRAVIRRTIAFLRENLE